MKSPTSIPSLALSLALTLAIAALPACSTCDVPGASAPKANVAAAARWAGPVVPTCWEDLAASSAADRGLVQAAVAAEISAHAAIELAGWGECPVGRFDGIRIGVADAAPRAAALGTGVRGVESGVLLNFSFRAWGTDCAASEGQRRACIRAIAVHEVLHALGFAHEQNRDDTPAACHRPAQGPDAEAFGEWDAGSAMNYCNPTWNNGGVLSAGDVAALQHLYGVRPGAKAALAAPGVGTPSTAAACTW